MGSEDGADGTSEGEVAGGGGKSSDMGNACFRLSFSMLYSWYQIGFKPDALITWMHFCIDSISSASYDFFVMH
jgi:hypothetical protein